MNCKGIKYEKIFKIELKKAIYNKYFLISVIIGCTFALLCLYGNVRNYQTGLEDVALKEEFLSAEANPTLPSNSLFNHWLIGEAHTFGNSVFFFIFPILVALPYGWSFCSEKKSGYIRSVVVHTGKKHYYLAKYLATFLSGGLAMVIPLLFNFLTTMLFIPAITPLVEYDMYYGVSVYSLMANLYYTIPFLYAFLYLCIDFVFTGLLACISMTAASFIRQQWIVVILPFFMCLAVSLYDKYIYLNFSTLGRQLSPFYFLRGYESGYPASFKVIFGFAGIIFLTTFLISNLWERKHDIY